MSGEIPDHPISRTLPLSTIRCDYLGHRMERVSGVTTLEDRKRIYVLVADSGSRGMTDLELAAKLGMPVGTATKRRRDLLGATGELRPLFGGETAQVWVIAGTTSGGGKS